MSLSYPLSVGVDTKMINSKYAGEERKKIQATTNYYMFPSLLLSGIVGGIVLTLFVAVIPFLLLEKI